MLVSESPRVFMTIFNNIIYQPFGLSTVEEVNSCGKSGLSTSGVDFGKSSNLSHHFLNANVNDSANFNAHLSTPNFKTSTDQPEDGHIDATKKKNTSFYSTERFVPKEIIDEEDDIYQVERPNSSSSSGSINKDVEYFIGDDLRKSGRTDSNAKNEESENNTLPNLNN